MNALIGDIATTISIIIVVKLFTAINIAIIIAACKPAVVNMLIAIDIFETFLASFVADFVKSG